MAELEIDKEDVHDRNRLQKRSLQSVKLSRRLQTAVKIVLKPPAPNNGGPDLPFFRQAGYVDPLDGWRCYSYKRVMSSQIQVRQTHTNMSGFAISSINKYMVGSRYL